MKISIICPIYNGEKYLIDLHNNIKNQKLNKDENIEIKYILTKSKDNSEKILNELNAQYNLIMPEEFSHSLIRENAALNSDADIIVFISQDIKIKNNVWLQNLINPIINGECEASFSRQIGQDNTIEKYTRERNYPFESRIVSKKDINKYQIRTFFYSDASSAVSAKVYKELNAYDGKNMPTNEDMYFAYKLIHAGYRIKYCADSEVYHSHKFTFKQLYKRYYDTGVFFKQNPYLLKYKSNESGINLAKYVFKRAIEEKNIKVILRIIPDFGIRYIAKTLGQKKK